MPGAGTVSVVPLSIVYESSCAVISLGFVTFTVNSPPAEMQPSAANVVV